MRRLATVCGVVAMLATGGCASTVVYQPVDRVAQARGYIPADLRKVTELTAGTDPTFEPMTYLDGSTFAGLDIDLGNAMAERLGFKVKWTKVAFGDIIPGVADHKIDFSMTSMFDKAKRQEKIDFVDYLYVGASIVVPKGTGDVGGLAGLCGRRVGVQAGTVYVDMTERQRQQCPAGAPLTVVTVEGDPIAEVAAGRAGAALNDYPIAVFDAEKNPALEISGRQLEAVPYGIGIAKDRKGLSKAFQAAFYLIVDDGTYDKLLAKWKLPEGSLKTGGLNGGV